MQQFHDVGLGEEEGRKELNANKRYGRPEGSRNVIYSVVQRWLRKRKVAGTLWMPITCLLSFLTMMHSSKHDYSLLAGPSPAHHRSFSCVVLNYGPLNSRSTTR